MYIFYSIIFICCIELIYITLTLLRYLFKNQASHYKINGFNVLPDIIKKNSNIINYDEHAKML
jgi:hypothetical protein